MTSPVAGLPVRAREQKRKACRDIPKNSQPSRGDTELILRLWQSGHTAKEIAQRTSRTEKTVLNR